MYLPQHFLFEMVAIATGNVKLNVRRPISVRIAIVHRIQSRRKQEKMSDHSPAAGSHRPRIAPHLPNSRIAKPNESAG
jgi:hypothetical protein